MTKKAQSTKSVVEEVKSHFDNDIDSVRIYQAVSFNKKNETFFSTRAVANKEICSITLRTDISAIEVRNAKDHIIVPLTNVSCIYLKSPVKVQAEKETQEAKKAAATISAAQRDTLSRPK